MTTQHDKAKRWRFGLRSLLVFTTITPVVVGIACGALGVTVQSMFFTVVVMLFWVGFVQLSISGLMFVTGNSDGFLARASGVTPDRAALLELHFREETERRLHRLGEEIELLRKYIDERFEDPPT